MWLCRLCALALSGVTTAAAAAAAHGPKAPPKPFLRNVGEEYSQVKRYRHQPAHRSGAERRHHLVSSGGVAATATAVEALGDMLGLGAAGLASATLGLAPALLGGLPGRYGLGYHDFPHRGLVSAESEDPLQLVATQMIGVYDAGSNWTLAVEPGPGVKPCLSPLWSQSEPVCANARQVFLRPLEGDSQQKVSMWLVPGGEACLPRCPKDGWYLQPSVRKLSCPGVLLADVPAAGLSCSSCTTWVLMALALLPLAFLTPCFVFCAYETRKNRMARIELDLRQEDMMLREKVARRLSTGSSSLAGQ